MRKPSGKLVPAQEQGHARETWSQLYPKGNQSNNERQTHLIFLPHWLILSASGNEEKSVWLFLGINTIYKSYKLCSLLITKFRN